MWTWLSDATRVRNLNQNSSHKPASAISNCSTFAEVNTHHESHSAGRTHAPENAR